MEVDASEPDQIDMMSTNALRTELRKVVEENVEMVEDVAFLRALEAAGVDNWDGYSIAQDMMDV